MLYDIMWIVVAFSIIGNIYVIQKKYTGFIIWFFTNSLWAAYDFYIENFSQGVLFLVYNIFAVYGFLSWKYPLQTTFYTFLIKGLLKGKGDTK